MKIKRIAKDKRWDPTTQKIIQLCFDPVSIDKYSAGLKLVFAVDDPPLFVKVEEVEADQVGRPLY